MKKPLLFALSIGLLVVLTICVSTDFSPASPTAMPTPDGNETPEKSVDIDELLADPSYLAECKAINSKKSDLQAGYLGVYPGITHPNEIESLLGKPYSSGIITEPSAKYKMLNYQTFGVRVNLAGDRIEAVSVDDAAHFPTAFEIISQYGCPDIIYKRSLDEEGDSNYSTVVFIYYKKVGLGAYFDHYPLRLESSAYGMEYFIPDNAQKILEYFGFYHADGYAAPATWDDAVTK